MVDYNVGNANLNILSIYQIGLVVEWNVWIKIVKFVIIKL